MFEKLKSEIYDLLIHIDDFKRTIFIPVFFIGSSIKMNKQLQKIFLHITKYTVVLKVNAKSIYKKRTNEKIHIK